MISATGTPVLKHVTMLSKQNDAESSPVPLPLPISVPSPTPLRRSTTAEKVKEKDSTKDNVKYVLNLNNVIGTTATNGFGLTVHDGSIAYTLGAGAVVADIQGGHGIINTRFFCTSSRHLQVLQSSQRIAGILGESIRYDHFGFIVPSHTSGFGTALLNNAGDSSSPLSSGSLSDDLSSLSLSPARGSMSKSSAINSKDRMKTSTAVALSHDKRLLAVGETGHQPKIFIYSLAKDSNGLPIAVIAEHRFGVKSLAFSPCGKFLASLGTMEDGFIHVWSLASLQEGSVTLHSSNRCITAVNDMKFINDSTIMTAGVRNMRLWKIDKDHISRYGEHKVATLSSRSVILGDCSMMVFTSVEPVNNSLCLIGTEQGLLIRHEYDNVRESSTIAICAEPQCKGTNTVPKSDTKTDAKAEPITALKYDSSLSTVWMFCNGLTSIPLEKALESRRLHDTEKAVNAQPELKKKRKRGTAVVTALYMVSPDEFLLLDNTTALRYAHYDTGRKEIDIDHKIIDFVGKKLNGLRTLDTSGEHVPRFLTWSADGLVKRWDYSQVYCFETCEFPVSEDIMTEWTSVCVSQDNSTVFAGNNLGQVIIKSGSSSQIFNAHIGAVTDMDYFRSSDSNNNKHKYELLATGSRDRTIQIFCKKTSDCEWGVLQTITDSHKANVLRVLFTKDGEKIVSCSTDRNIFVHSAIFKDDKEKDQLVGFMSTKIVSLKNSPADMVLNDQNELILALSKTVYVYGITKGDLVKEYRVLNESENAQLTLIAYDRGHLAVAGSDKCLKLYDHASGDLRSTHWGHSSSIAGMVWVHRTDGTSSLVAGTQDGSIFLWDLVQETVNVDGPRSSSLLEDPFVSQDVPVLRSGTPTRKVLRKDELSKFLPERSAQTLGRASIAGTTTGSVTGTGRQASPSSSSPTRGRMSMAPMQRVDRLATKSVSPVRSLPKEEGSITDLCKLLRKFQESYSSSNRQPITSSLSMELRKELRNTLDLLEGQKTGSISASTANPVPRPTARSPTRSPTRSPVRPVTKDDSNNVSDDTLERLVEKFGDKLMALVEKRLAE